MFGPRFINVMDGDFGTRGSDNLLLRVHEAQGTIPEAGPVTLYIGRRATLPADLDLDARYSVMFGPGARVRLIAGVRWTIRGDTDLGTEQRFELADRSQVALLGPIEQILPEWWGVSSDVDEALRHAFLAAALRIEEQVPQAPIELLGPYALRRPLSLVPPVDREAEYVVEGRHPRGDATLSPTLSYADPLSSDFPLVSLVDGVRLRMRHVALDASSRRALQRRKSRTPAAVEMRGRFSGAVLDRCTFFVDRGGAIVLSPEATPPAPDASAEHRLVALRECWFESASQRPDDVTMISVAPALRARLRIEGCAFRGAARAMVSVAAGVCEVIGSDFENRSIALSDPGVDFELGTLAGAAPTGEPLMFSETHTRSLSLRHLVGGTSGSLSSSVVTLTGVVHSPQYGALAVNLRPAAIRWEGLLESEMLVQGCDIGGSISAPAPIRIASLASRLRGSPDVAGGASLVHAMQPG